MKPTDPGPESCVKCVTISVHAQISLHFHPIFFCVSWDFNQMLRTAMCLLLTTEQLRLRSDMQKVRNFKMKKRERLYEVKYVKINSFLTDFLVNKEYFMNVCV